MTSRPLRVLANHEMASLDPGNWLSDSSSAFVILKLVCPSLVRLDPQMNVEPDLAESWTVAPDCRSFHFKLRRDVVMHSGRPLTADLVVWNFRRIMDSRTGSLLASDYAGLREVRKDSDGIVVEFDKPFPAFLHHLAWRTYIVDDCAMQPSGAGPFKIDRWDRGERIVLGRHDRYHEPGKPTVDSVVFEFAIGARERLEAIRAGTADVVEAVPAKEADQLEAEGLLRTATIRSVRRTSVVFNCAVAPFNDLRVRQAVAHAVDRRRHVAEIYGTRGEALEALYPAASEWHTVLPPYAYDPERAKALLTAAGVTLPLKVRGVASAISRLGDRVAEDLAKVGIELSLTIFDDPPWWPFIYLRPDSLRPPWQLAVQGVGTRPHPDITFRRDHYSGASFNATGFVDPELDALILRARSAITKEEQLRLYAETQACVHRGLPELPIVCPDTVIGWRPGTRGLLPHPIGTLNLQDVKID